MLVCRQYEVVSQVQRPIGCLAGLPQLGVELAGSV